jgi:hypothetical protein
MATLTVEVDDNELSFLRDLLNKFPFVRVSDEREGDYSRRRNEPAFG